MPDDPTVLDAPSAVEGSSGANLPWLTDTLWPQSRRITAWRGRRVRRFVALSSAAAPTQLLPWSPRSVVATAARRSDQRSRRRSLTDAAGVAALLAAAPFSATRRLVLADTAATSMVDHLRAELDSSIRTAVVLCGPARANQKPVLQLLNRAGRTVAFAKVAWNPFTRALLESERNALELLAAHPALPFTVPAIVGSGEFAGGQWIAISAVGVDHRRAPGWASTVDLARAIERTAPEWSGDLAAGAFARRLDAAAANLPLARQVVTRLLEVHGRRPTVLRPSHGDFVPWNYLTGRSTFAVWDWERYDLARPVGFDRLHHEFQVELHQRTQPTHVAVATIQAALTRILPEMDLAEARFHFDCYLADLICRYEGDGVTTCVASTMSRAAELAEIVEKREALL